MGKTIKTIDQRNSIRIALLGCISSGKSTLLNGICVNQYEDMKRKKTTMIPTVYKGSTNTIYRNKDEINRIKSKNKELNETFYDDSSKVLITSETCKLHENIIPMIENFIDLPKGIFLDIYDIPGLNDPSSKPIYFQWVKDNFNEFDIIINVCNIESGLNTTDEMDILNLITDCIKNSIQGNRDILFVTAINKCDEMEILEGDIPTLIDSEDLELQKQIINTTCSIVKDKLYLDEQGKLIHNSELQWESMGKCVVFTPITARDTFIYRMLHNNPNVELDMSLLNKFGLNELGKKKWTRLSNDEKRLYIKNYFNDSTIDINDILKESGYINFKNEINTFLTKERQSHILISRLKIELQNEELINKNITKDKHGMQELINLYNNYTIRVSTIDSIYKTKNSGLITDLINNHINRWINEISDLSNNMPESIERLEEYKEIMILLENNLDSRVIRNKITVNISDGKDKRWSDSLGTGFKDIPNVDKVIGRFTLTKLFTNLYKGYSDLQNEYYLTQLKDITKMNNFPHDMFIIIDKLKYNRFDNIETLLDDMIKTVKDGITPQHSTYQSFRNLHNGPLSNYIPNNANMIKIFSELLIHTYDYPKVKIIEFIQYYMMNIYNIYKSTPPPPSSAAFTTLSDNLIINIEKSYCILLQDYLNNVWLRGIDPLFEHFFENLKIINNSYIGTHSINLDPFINYVEAKQSILIIPTYLISLMSDPKRDSDSCPQKSHSHSESDCDEFSSPR